MKPEDKAWAEKVQRDYRIQESEMVRKMRIIDITITIVIVLLVISAVALYFTLTGG